MKRQKNHLADCDHKKIKLQTHFKYEHEAKLNAGKNLIIHRSISVLLGMYVYVTEETTNLFHVKSLLSQLLTTMLISLSVV